jgi:hypothetical protein
LHLIEILQNGLFLKVFKLSFEKVFNNYDIFYLKSQISWIKLHFFEIFKNSELEILEKTIFLTCS